MAFNQEKFITDLIWGELIQIINFMYSAEGKESERSQALDCWRTRLSANPSDLIDWLR
jgi:hypothetical protein